MYKRTVALVVVVVLWSVPALVVAGDDELPEAVALTPVNVVLDLLDRDIEMAPFTPEIPIGDPFDTSQFTKVGLFIDASETTSGLFRSSVRCRLKWQFAFDMPFVAMQEGSRDVSPTSGIVVPVSGLRSQLFCGFVGSPEAPKPVLRDVRVWLRRE